MIAPRRTTAPVRGFARWLPRSGGAVLASVAVHAVAAVMVGGVLAASTRGGEHQPRMVELELASAVDIAANLPLPAAAPPVAAPAEPVRAHPSPRRRVAMRPTPAVLAVQSPSPAGAAETPEERPHFAMSAGTVASRAAASVAPASTDGAGSAATGVASSTLGDSTFGEGDVNVPARLLAPSPLVYPAAARAAEIETDLPVEIVVDGTGHVIRARPLSHAGYGLDEAALRAIRDYRFLPAQRSGRAVPVRMRWIVQFRLR